LEIVTSRAERIAEIKRLIISECEKNIAPENIGDNDLLFGPTAPLALDSLDALQLAMALQKRFGVRLVDSKETRRVMASVASLADFLDVQ
jgi:acyl carrier protein